MSTENKNSSAAEHTCSDAEKARAASHPIKSMMDVTLSKIKDMVDVSTIVGDPIVRGEITIIPISKLSYGFASGGSDFDGKAGHRCFGGGGGAGVTVQPVAFIVITADDVRLIQIDNHMNSLDKAIGMIPGLVDKVSDMVSGREKPRSSNVSSEYAESGDKSEPMPSDDISIK